MRSFSLYVFYLTVNMTVLNMGLTNSLVTYRDRCWLTNNEHIWFFLKNRNITSHHRWFMPKTSLASVSSSIASLEVKHQVQKQTCVRNGLSFEMV